MQNDIICIPITFNNPKKFVFRNRKIYYNPNAPATNCKSIFLNEKKQVFSGFLKIIGAQI